MQQKFKNHKTKHTSVPAPLIDLENTQPDKYIMAAEPLGGTVLLVQDAADTAK
jgi:hypothetical protein